MPGREKCVIEIKYANILCVLMMMGCGSTRYSSIPRGTIAMSIVFRLLHTHTQTQTDQLQIMKSRMNT